MGGILGIRVLIGVLIFLIRNINTSAFGTVRSASVALLSIIALDALSAYHWTGWNLKTQEGLNVEHSDTACKKCHTTGNYFCHSKAPGLLNHEFALAGELTPYCENKSINSVKY